MNYIGKILPIEGYYVVVKSPLPEDYAKSLTHLYQPLIGIQAVTLYLTLLHEVELQKEGLPQTHHTLMNYLNLPLDEIYQARLKLEGIGLLKTYENKEETENNYTYEIQSPFSPQSFFLDGMLTQLLYHHIGKDKFELLQEHYTKQFIQKGTNITVSFNEVFQTFQPQAPASHVKSNKESASNEEVVDFTWIEQMLRQRMIPAKRVLTGENKRLITQMMQLYDLETFEIEKSLLWALTEDNELNIDEFKTACHDLFKSKYKETDIQLTEKQAPTQMPTQKVTTKEDQLVMELEKISPKQLLEDLSSGNHASDQDMKVIREVMTTQGLPSPVMNVLIHYVLLQTNMKLSKAYLGKIASHWSRANLKTAKEAMEFAKRESKNLQKGNQSTSTYKKTVSKEIIPDWFKDRKKKQPTTDTEQNIDKEKEQKEIEALLRQFSSENG
ncbi:replication initiation and membrane attachment family protein [Oceanobacillus manasiensis]|uniref:replication initiation and membrane attachment family protein n=1 Tax=Oceanobacillus manasiensis TaxID=586413 RepID=UPI0005A648A3|nr:DnaD domain protein [Oceanobacillus manasiensis]